ncbi:hypothetical protein PV326_008744 [Microctonus aethiopoides]|nr:hypothetical protein PV326_008744 [Microctonus aethiopoides]
MISGLHHVAHPEAHWSDFQLEFNEVSPMNTAPMLQGTSVGSCEEAKQIGGSSLASVVAGSSKPTRTWDKPYFGDITQKNVTAIVGQKAMLSCHVKHPGNRTVSYLKLM